jgi:Reverse transcriptase (RNA-dependent DNA polymerase)
VPSATVEDVSDKSDDEDKVQHELTPVGDSEDSEDELNCFSVVEFVGAVDEPTTYCMAVNGPDRVHWKCAAEEEINTLVANGTWEVVDHPPDVKLLCPGWVFKVKMNPDGSIECYKGHLVTKGCAQHLGLNYTKVFASTFCPAALRLILALSAAEDLHLRSIDISSGFTYGELEKDIYMFQPEGFHKGGPNKVLKLRKLLYSLK